MHGDAVKLHRKITRWGDKIESFSEEDFKTLNPLNYEDLERFYVCEECFRIEMYGVEQGTMSLNSSLGAEPPEDELASKWPCATARELQKK